MPFHQYNPFTGRLRESTRLQPFYPISPVPLQKSEPPVMIYDTIKTKPVTVGQVARASTFPGKMAEVCKKYQVDLEKPVYLLAGKKDKILFGITSAIVVAGLLQGTYYIVTEGTK